MRFPWWRRRRRETELEDEIQSHLQMAARDRIERGESLENARDAARREFGNTGLIKDVTRDVWGWRWIADLAQDLRYAARMLVKSPGFTAVVILTLGLGIGANTAIFSFMDSLLLRSLPVRDPASLVVLNWHAQARRGPEQGVSGSVPVVQSMSGNTYDDPHSGTTAGIFPFPALELFQGKSDSVFSSVFAYYPAYPAKSLSLTIKGETELASGEYISGDFFHGLGVPAAAGRLVISEDDRAGAPPVVVISFALGQTRFGEAAEAVGQSILINNQPFAVVGVTPPGFFGVDPALTPELYLPMHTNVLVESAYLFGKRPADYLDRNYYWIEMMARLRPGVSLAQAQAVLAPQFQQWVMSTATNDQQRANLPTLMIQEGAGGVDRLRRKYSKPLFVLLALVGLILAMACANVANLLLVRAAVRTREMALRLSLGAGWLRVARQMLTESILLSSLGGALGVLLTMWGGRFLTLLLADGRANFTLHAELNWHVLGAVAGLSLFTGVLFGLAPALQSTRVDVMPALKETRTGQPGARHSFWSVRLSHMLVVFQIALSLLLLVAAGLFVRTLGNLQSVELGFNRDNVLLFQLDARKGGHKSPELTAFYGDLLKRFSAIPGVRRASLSHESLIDAGSGLPINVPGAPPDPANRYLTVGPAFFETMQIPILAGRGIEERDHAGSPAVAVINERFAKTNFGAGDPLGQHLILSLEGYPSRDMVIVGVSRDTRYGGLKRDIPPVVYIAYDQGFPEPREMVYALRTAGQPLAYANTIREIVRQADARVPVFNVRTQTADIDQTINQEITFAKLCTAFAILALLIASVGLYGTVAYNVARRTGEIGIRMALGAQRGTVVRMVVREIIVLAGVGLAISVPTALGTSKFVESFLFGMKPNDPLALGIATATLVSAALLAGYIPARKASRIDPMTALRHE